MTITVAIPTIGRSSLGATLASVAQQTRQADQIVIVNQGDPGGRSWVPAELESRLTWIDDDGRGLSRARNRILTEVQSEWCYWIDDDEEAEPANLERLEEIATVFPDLAFVGGSYLAPLDLPPDAICPVLYPHGDVLVDADSWGTTQAFGVVDVWGGNVAYRRDLREKVGLYDLSLGAGTERFPRGEDTDYNVRALSAGFRGMLTARMPILHTFGARKPTGREREYDVQTSAVLAWKSRQDPLTVNPELAARLHSYGRKKSVVSRLTGGLVFADEQVSAKLYADFTQQLDRDFVLKDGVLIAKTT